MKIQPKNYTKVIKHYLKCGSQQETAKEFGVSQGLISLIMIKNKIQSVEYTKEKRTKNLGNFAKRKDFKLLDKYSLGYCIGVLIGDGNITKNSFRLECIDLDFAKKTELSVKKAFGLEPHFHKRNREKYKQGFSYFVEVHNTNLADYLRKFKSNTNTILEIKNKKIKIGIIDGFYDSEGSVIIVNKNTNIGIIKYVQKKKETNDVIIKILESFGINCKRNKDRIYETIIIRRAENIKLFKNNFVFSIKRKQENLDLISKPTISKYTNYIRYNIKR